MRYAIVSLGRPLAEVAELVRQQGGTELRLLPGCGQLFATLDPEQAARLAALPGLAVSPVREMRAQQVAAPAQVRTTLSPLFEAFRRLADPPVTGAGFTLAILDSGVRQSHHGLQGKVVHEANLSTAATAEDLFDHGTGVAYLAAGGEHGGDAGMAPGAKLMNIKVMDDQGVGTEETVAAGLEEVLRLRLVRSPASPLFPALANLSLGAADTGNPLSPVRVAARRLLEAGVLVVAAAGNQGPAPTTVAEPATEPGVLAVGAMTLEPWEVWPQSSRGPTREGVVKPDVMFLGVDILTASGKGDNTYVLKTGTSFAAPAISGLAVLLQEGFARFTGRRLSLEEIGFLIPFHTRKPGGSPTGKDNTYGYGMPFADLVRHSFRPSAAFPVEALTPLLSLGLLAGLVGGLSRAMREE